MQGREYANLKIEQQGISQGSVESYRVPYAAIINTASLSGLKHPYCRTSAYLPGTRLLGQPADGIGWIPISLTRDPT